MPAPAGFAAPPPASPTTVVQNDFFALIPFKPARRKARAYTYASLAVSRPAFPFVPLIPLRRCKHPLI